MHKMKVINHILTMRNLNRLLKMENDKLSSENLRLKKKLKKIKEERSIFKKIKDLLLVLKKKLGLI